MCGQMDIVLLKRNYFSPMISGQRLISPNALEVSVSFPRSQLESGAKPVTTITYGFVQQHSTFHDQDNRTEDEVS